MRKNFKAVYIEITNSCNLKCSFCSEDKKQKQSLNVKQFKHIINNVKPVTDYVYLHVKGEPLIHPELGAFLDICRDNGISVNLTTNGTLLAQNSKMLLSKPALRQVNISLHAEHDQDISEYFSGIMEFAYRATERDIYVSLRLWRARDKQTVQLLNLLSNVFTPAINPGSRDSVKLAENLYISFDLPFEWPSLNMPDNRACGTCHGTRTHISVLTDGTVTPCCLDSQGIINLGNIFKDKITDIIKSEKFINIQKGFRNRKIVETLCKKCTYRNRFDLAPV